MKRGIWLIVLCAIAISVSAANESIGTFKKGPGESWLVDDHNLSVVKRDIMEESFIYVAFDELKRSITLHDCVWFKNYEVCFTNSTPGANFSYEWGTTPYVYWLKIRAETAATGIDVKVSDAKMVLGQTVTVNIGVRNSGQVAIEELNFTTDLAGASVTGMHGPCVVRGSNVVWQGRLYMDEAISCWFDLRPLLAKTFEVKPTATFFDGRKMTTASGKPATIDARGGIMSARLANSTARLGEWVRGVITLDNTNSGTAAWFKGTLRAQGGINGTTSFDEMVPEGKNVSKTFLAHMTRVGNNTVTLSGSYRVDSQSMPVTMATSCVVAEPRLKLAFFGDKEVAPNASAHIEVEGENLEQYTLSNLQTVIEVANVSQAPGVTIRSLDEGEKEQLFYAAITPGRTSIVAATVSYDTPFGERLRKEAKMTLTVTGTTPVTATTNATTPSANKTTGTTGTTTGTPGAKPPAAAQEPAASGKTTLLLLAIVIGVVGISGLWLVLQSKKSPEE